MSNWCNFTASKSERAWHCAASFALPEVPRKAGYPAQRGTFGHSYLEAGLRGNQEDADLFLFDKRVPAWWLKDMEQIKVEEVREKIYALTNGEGDLLLEAAYEYTNGFTSYLGQSIGRNYPKGADFTGSADVVVDADNFGSVTDFKFGSKAVEPDCMQLRNLGLVTAQHHGWNKVIVSVAQFDKSNGMSLPEELPSKTYTTAELWLAKADLDATINNINEARRLVMLGETPKVNPGEWCKWCDCTGCENYQGLLMPTYAVKRSYIVEVVKVVTAIDENLAYKTAENTIRDSLNALHTNDKILVTTIDSVESKITTLFDEKKEGKLQWLTRIRFLLLRLRSLARFSRLRSCVREARVTASPPSRWLATTARIRRRIGSPARLPACFCLPSLPRRRIPVSLRGWLRSSPRVPRLRLRGIWRLARTPIKPATRCLRCRWFPAASAMLLSIRRGRFSENPETTLFPKKLRFYMAHLSVNEF